LQEEPEDLEQVDVKPFAIFPVFTEEELLSLPAECQHVTGCNAEQAKEDMVKIEGINRVLVLREELPPRWLFGMQRSGRYVPYPDITFANNGRYDVGSFFLLDVRGIFSFLFFSLMCDMIQL
jgi:hypothetical protein